jgi:hypothetical protein
MTWKTYEWIFCRAAYSETPANLSSWALAAVPAPNCTCSDHWASIPWPGQTLQDLQRQNEISAIRILRIYTPPNHLKIRRFWRQAKRGASIMPFLRCTRWHPMGKSDPVAPMIEPHDDLCSRSANPATRCL